MHHTKHEFPQKCYEQHRPKGKVLHNEQLNPAKAGFEMEGRFQCYCSSLAHPTARLVDELKSSRCGECARCSIFMPKSRWSGRILQWVWLWQVKIYRIGCLTLLPRGHHPLLSKIFPEDSSCHRTRSANQPSVKLCEPGEDSCTSDIVAGISPSSPHWHVFERLKIK